MSWCKSVDQFPELIGCALFQITRFVMAEGMEVDLDEGPGPSSSGGKTKKRFEVKKVIK